MLLTVVSIFTNVVIGAAIPQPQGQTHAKYGSSIDVNGKQFQLLKPNLAGDKDDVVFKLAPIMFITTGCSPYPAFDEHGAIVWDHSKPATVANQSCINAKLAQLYARKVTAMRNLKKLTAVIYAWRAFGTDGLLGWNSLIVWGKALAQQGKIVGSDPISIALWTGVDSERSNFIQTTAGGPIVKQIDAKRFALGRSVYPSYDITPVDDLPKNVEGAITWQQTIDVDRMHLASGKTLGQIIDAMPASDGCPLANGNWQKHFKTLEYCTEMTCPETWSTISGP